MFNSVFSQQNLSTSIRTLGPFLKDLALNQQNRSIGAITKFSLLCLMALLAGCEAEEESRIPSKITINDVRPTAIDFSVSDTEVRLKITKKKWFFKKVTYETLHGQKYDVGIYDSLNPTDAAARCIVNSDINSGIISDIQCADNTASLSCAVDNSDRTGVTCSADKLVENKPYKIKVHVKATKEGETREGTISVNVSTHKNTPQEVMAISRMQEIASWLNNFEKNSGVEVPDYLRARLLTRIDHSSKTSLWHIVRRGNEDEISNALQELETIVLRIKTDEIIKLEASTINDSAHQKCQNIHSLNDADALSCGKMIFGKSIQKQEPKRNLSAQSDWRYSAFGAKLMLMAAQVLEVAHPIDRQQAYKCSNAGNIDGSDESFGKCRRIVEDYHKGVRFLRFDIDDASVLLKGYEGSCWAYDENNKDFDSTNGFDVNNKGVVVTENGKSNCQIAEGVFSGTVSKFAIRRVYTSPVVKLSLDRFLAIRENVTDNTRTIQLSKINKDTGDIECSGNQSDGPCFDYFAPLTHGWTEEISAEALSLPAGAINVAGHLGNPLYVCSHDSIQKNKWTQMPSTAVNTLVKSDSGSWKCRDLSRNEDISKFRVLIDRANVHDRKTFNEEIDSAQYNHNKHQAVEVRYDRSQMAALANFTEWINKLNLEPNSGGLAKLLVYPDKQLGFGSSAVPTVVQLTAVEKQGSAAYLGNPMFMSSETGEDLPWREISTWTKTETNSFVESWLGFSDSGLAEFSIQTPSGKMLALETDGASLTHNQSIDMDVPGQLALYDDNGHRLVYSLFSCTSEHSRACSYIISAVAMPQFKQEIFFIRGKETKSLPGDIVGAVELGCLKQSDNLAADYAHVRLADILSEEKKRVISRVEHHAVSSAILGGLKWVHAMTSENRGVTCRDISWHHNAQRNLGFKIPYFNGAMSELAASSTSAAAVYTLANYFSGFERPVLSINSSSELVSLMCDSIPILDNDTTNSLDDKFRQACSKNSEEKLPWWQLLLASINANQVVLDIPSPIEVIPLSFFWAQSYQIDLVHAMELYSVWSQAEANSNDVIDIDLLDVDSFSALEYSNADGYDHLLASSNSNFQPSYHTLNEIRNAIYGFDGAVDPPTGFEFCEEERVLDSGWPFTRSREQALEIARQSYIKNGEVDWGEALLDPTDVERLTQLASRVLTDMDVMNQLPSCLTKNPFEGTIWQPTMTPHPDGSGCLLFNPKLFGEISETAQLETVLTNYGKDKRDQMLKSLEKFQVASEQDSSNSRTTAVDSGHGRMLSGVTKDPNLPHVTSEFQYKKWLKTLDDESRFIGNSISPTPKFSPSDDFTGSIRVRFTSMLPKKQLYPIAKGVTYTHIMDVDFTPGDVFIQNPSKKETWFDENFPRPYDVHVKNPYLAAACTDNEGKADAVCVDRALSMSVASKYIVTVTLNDIKNLIKVINAGNPDKKKCIDKRVLAKLEGLLKMGANLSSDFIISNSVGFERPGLDSPWTITRGSYYGIGANSGLSFKQFEATHPRISAMAKILDEVDYGFGLSSSASCDDDAYSCGAILGTQLLFDLYLEGGYLRGLWKSKLSNAVTGLAQTAVKFAQTFTSTRFKASAGLTMRVFGASSPPAAIERTSVKRFYALRFYPWRLIHNTQTTAAEWDWNNPLKALPQDKLSVISGTGGI